MPSVSFGSSTFISSGAFVMYNRVNSSGDFCKLFLLHKNILLCHTGFILPDLKSNLHPTTESYRKLSWDFFNNVFEQKNYFFWGGGNFNLSRIWIRVSKITKNNMTTCCYFSYDHLSLLYVSVSATWYMGEDWGCLTLNKLHHWPHIHLNQKPLKQPGTYIPRFKRNLRLIFIGTSRFTHEPKPE